MGAVQTVKTERADIIDFPEGIPTVMPNRNIGYRFVKRTFDIVGSLLGLAVLSPVFLATAAAVYIDDPGAVLFFQDRNGLNGKVFRMRSIQF